MQNFKKNWIPGKLLVVPNYGKMVHLPHSTTRTFLGIFIYTTNVCDDTPLS